MNYLVLVNKQNKIDDSFYGELKLIETNDALDRTIQIEKETYNAYFKLKSFLETVGIYILIDSCYRNLDEQQKILDDSIRIEGIEHASMYVAPVGYSEHHTGLAVDLALVVDGKKIVDDGVIDLFEYDDIFKQIHKYLSEYGFILRYPEGKEKITGYGYEPWHIRYVKDPEIASYITENNLTLEEYLELRK